MKSMIIRAAAAVAVFTVVSAAPVAAQVANPIGFNVRAGAALPVGDFGDGPNTGFVLGAGLTFRPPLMPVGFRFDGDYTRFGFEDDGSGDPDVNMSIWSLTANAEIAPAMSPIYFVGGAGVYSYKFGASGFGSTDSETDLGVNGGAGIRLPLSGFSAFVEARYHHVFSKDDALGIPAITYVPIVFGVNF